jgi:hypothetical protein
MTPRFAVAALLLSTVAAANPRPLPYSYTYPTLPEGKLEVEQHVDMVPVLVPRELEDGTQEAVFGVRSLLQTELEVGVTDRLELGWYFVFQQAATGATPFLRFRGVKQRVRYRLAEEGEWPVDVGLYLELAEYHDEFELEEKVLLSRRFGRLTVVANLWVEQEWYFQTRELKLLFNPTLGATYEVSPRVSVGLEYWSRGRFGAGALSLSEDDPVTPRHYAGPTLMVQSGELWLSLGVYGRLDGLLSAPALNDGFGKLWVRAVLGFGL